MYVSGQESSEEAVKLMVFRVTLFIIKHERLSCSFLWHFHRPVKFKSNFGFDNLFYDYSLLLVQYFDKLCFLTPQGQAFITALGTPALRVLRHFVGALLL